MKKMVLLMGVLLLFNYVAWAQHRQLKGKITDAQTNEPLPAVTISVKGSSMGGASDAEGMFSISIPSGEVTLVFNYIGYGTREIKVSEGQTGINVQMTAVAKGLDEVVVIGYGAVKKSDLTGSVTSLKAEELKKIPTGNVVEAIQGKVPGLDITRTSGSSNAGVNVTVRGTRSINAGNGPLYVIDGVQYSNVQDINSNDIQSMEVLKDASSTAIYGSRGANGVIIITTKKGTSGKAKVSFNTYAGMSKVAGYPSVNDATGYVALAREANRTTGKWASPADDSKIFNTTQLDAINNNIQTNFSDLLLHNGMQQDYQVGLTAGSEKLRSYISLDYYNEKGVLMLDNLQRYTGRLNLDYDLNRYLTLGTQTQVTFNNQSTRQDPLNLANKISPLTFAFNEDGSLNMVPNQGKDINPLADEQNGAFEDNASTTRLFPTLYAELKPFKGLNARTVFSFNSSSTRQGVFKSANTIARFGQASEASYANTNSRNLSWENIITYQKELKGHSLTVTGISSYLKFENETASALGRNLLLTSQLYYALANSTQDVSIYSNYNKNTLVSYAGRVNYGYKSKYLLTLTGRFDGASVLGEGNKWDFFPSVAGAWRPIAEDFLKDSKVMSDLKVRASYGISGNSSVSAYSSQSSLVRIPFAYGDSPAAGFAYAKQIGNPDLKWEKSATTDIGVDFGLFNNRVSGTVDVYDTRTSDLLYDRVMPLTSGVSIITQNIGKTRNKGIELSLTTQNIVKPSFNWATTFSFFKNNEEIVALTDGATVLNTGTTSTPKFLVVGSPVNSFYDFEKVGIWQNSELDQATKYGKKPGDIKIKDQDDDGVIDNIHDRKVIGSAVPSWSGGFNSDLTFKNFEFSFYIYARMGQTINSAYMSRFDPQGIENSATVSYWTPENPTNDWPRPTTAVSFTSLPYASTLGYMDGSFIKLRSVSLGYNLPKSLISKLSVQRAKIYVTGKNLFCISDLDGYDPESAGSLTNPLTRLFVAGINLEF
ncbi:SusC/RagA family protein [Solitalea longa]|uniref:SusC/RagA family protein n=2 Tax=Solitalea longa TaxID=2079460 RepID=A0A2S5A0P7_9SPHI|nr:SusC/RagA family protein [Solitalea longa]